VVPLVLAPPEAMLPLAVVVPEPLAKPPDAPLLLAPLPPASTPEPAFAPEYDEPPQLMTHRANTATSGAHHINQLRCVFISSPIKGATPIASVVRPVPSRPRIQAGVSGAG
jgi:hypothetical protein